MHAHIEDWLSRTKRQTDAVWNQAKAEHSRYEADVSALLAKRAHLCSTLDALYQLDGQHILMKTDAEVDEAFAGGDAFQDEVANLTDRLNTEQLDAMPRGITAAVCGQIQRSMLTTMATPHKEWIQKRLDPLSLQVVGPDARHTLALPSDCP